MYCTVPDVNGSLESGGTIGSCGGLEGLWTLPVVLDLKVSDVPEVY